MTSYIDSLKKGPMMIMTLECATKFPKVQKYLKEAHEEIEALQEEIEKTKTLKTLKTSNEE